MKEGYDFDGWTGTDLYVPTTQPDIPRGSIGNMLFTANFTPIVYEITYDLGEGTNNTANPASYTVESETISLLAPSREGYDFMGWLLDGEPVTEIQAGSSGNKTLTAT